MKRDTFCFVACLFAAATFTGCEETKDNGKSSQGPPARKEYKKGDLNAELADYLGVSLDGGRVEIAPPKDWYRPPRGTETPPQIAVFPKTKSSSVPAIIIVAEDDTTEIKTVTKENLDDFVDRVTEELKDKELEEQVRPMIIVGRPCARYVRLGSLKKTTVERQFLVTVVAGRRFTVELRVHKGMIKKDRDAAYAVLGGMRFLEETSGANTDPPPSDSTEKTDG